MDWKSQVSQNQRNSKVKQISEELAKMEEGATSASVLSISMRLEEQIFNKASSLENYEQLLAKRLKKLKKKTGGTNQQPAAAASSEKVEETKKAETYEVQEKRLRVEYGEKLRFIIINSREALKVFAAKAAQMNSKYKLYMEIALQQALDIGAIDEGTMLKVTSPLKDSSNTTSSLVLAQKKRRSDEDRRKPGFLDDIEADMKKSVELLRGHILKAVDIDGFLQERLEEHASKISLQASNMSVAVPHISQINNSADNLKTQFDRTVSKRIRLPARGASEDERKECCLVQIQRVKEATELLMGYILTDKNNNNREKLSGIPKQAYALGAEAINYLVDNYLEKKKKLTLSDAWTKVLVYTPPNVVNIDEDLTSSTPMPATLSHFNVLSSKILFNPGRRVPNNVIQALETNNAMLLGESELTPRVQLKFDAFMMILFFKPLLVRVRSIDEALFTPPRNKVDDWSPIWVDDQLESTTVIDPSEKSMVKYHLETASHRATMVLRQCFSQVRYEGRSDFEVEIEECSSLLHFFRLCRETFVASNKV